MARKEKVIIHPNFPVGDNPDTPEAARALLKGMEARALRTMLEDPTVLGHDKAVEVVEGAAGPKPAA